VVASGFGVVASATWLAGQVNDFLQPDEEALGPEVEPGQPVLIEVPEGATAEEIGELLVEAGVLRSVRQFESAVDAAGVANSLKAGSFDLETGMNPDAAIAVLIAGPQLRVYNITIREGLWVVEILNRLARDSGIPRAEFEAALTSGDVTTSLKEMPDSPTLQDWEGLLFPDTYEFSELSTATDILNRMARTMESRMNSVDWTSFEEAGFTRYDGIVIASLIESEVRVADERPIVSSVIRNRLDDGEILGIDASTLYAQGTRDPAEIDVDFDSPYNTRRVGGLPPGPIAAPGLASLQAAAAPADTPYRYYVLANAETGAHVFAETEAEHEANVEKAREDGVIP
jgi:UPF0755 protein